MVARIKGDGIMKSVLIDTSFFIRLLDETDPLCENAKMYLKYFLENKIACKISTIAIAEFSAGGDVKKLPWKLLKTVSFDVLHALTAGKFMKEVYAEKRRRGATFLQRTIVPNDTKMFAQAHFEQDICYFASADSEAKKVYDMLPKPDFEFIDISKLTHPLTTTE